MYGAVEPGRPVAFGGTVRVTTLAELLRLVKEAEVLTGSPGRTFIVSMCDGTTQRLHIGFDGYMLRVDPGQSKPVLFAPESFGSGSMVGAALEEGRLYTEPM